jgi:hypothetical protein
LRAKVKEENDTIGIEDLKKKKQPKLKERKEEGKSLDVVFKTSEEERRYDNKDRNYNKKKPAKFHFTQEDFPEL